MLDCCYDAAPSSSTSESGGASPQELATPPQDEVDEEFGAVRPGLVDFDSDALALPVTVATKTTTEFRLLAHYDTISSSALLVGPEPEKYHTRVLNLARDVCLANLGPQKTLSANMGIALLPLPRPPRHILPPSRLLWRYQLQEITYGSPLKHFKAFSKRNLKPHRSPRLRCACPDFHDVKPSFLQLRT